MQARGGGRRTRGSGGVLQYMMHTVQAMQEQEKRMKERIDWDLGCDGEWRWSARENVGDGVDASE